MLPNERAAKKKGLRHLIKNMSQLEVAGHGATPMSGADLKGAVGEAAAAGTDPDHDGDNDAAELGAEGAGTGGAPPTDDALGEEAEGKEPSLEEHVKSFMKRGLHNNRPDEKGSRVVMRMISAEPADRAPKPSKSAPKAPRYPGRR